MGDQIAVLLAAIEGLFDDVALEDMEEVQKRVLARARAHLPEVRRRILEGEELSDDDRAALTREARAAIEEG